LAASTPTLVSSDRALAPRAADRRLATTRLALAAITVVAVLGFALYAAYLASRVEDVIAPVPIAVPSKGAVTPFGIGQYAADFALTDLDGNTVHLFDFAGRPVWVNVWASWCAPCRAEMPDIDATYRELRSSAPGGDLALLMVSLGEDAAVVRRYVTTTKYQLPVLVDPTFEITRSYRITGLPTHYFVDRDGVIRDLAIGGLKPNSMRSRLSRITGAPGNSRS
jgi:thiol-disulfide isomerase/thioredoxin